MKLKRKPKPKAEQETKLLVIPEAPIGEVKVSLRGATSLLWNPPSTVLDRVKELSKDIKERVDV